MITTSGNGVNLINTSASLLNNVSSWGTVTNGLLTSKNTTGRSTPINSSGSSISLIVSSSVDSSNFYVSATSPTSTLSGLDNNGYYKLIFYVKVGNFVSTSGTPNIIAGSALRLTTTASGTTPYYYRVVPVGSTGQTYGPDTVNNLDSASILSTTTSTHTISWDPVTNAAAYKIYRANSLGEILWIGTTSLTSQTDSLNRTGSYLDNDSFNTNIKLSPSISLRNAANDYVGVSQTCKVFESTDGNPSNFSNTIDVNCERWQKVEICFGVDNDDKTNWFNKFNLNLNISANHQYAELLITDFNLYKITEFDFKYQNLFPTQSAFLPTRPGEALIHPLLPIEDTKIKNKGVSASKPVSFITKSTTEISPSTFPTRTQLPEEYNKFKYFISSSDESKSLQAFYDQYLSLNKIVLKFDQSYSTFNSGSINIYTGSTNTKTSIPLSSSSINANGITVLYYSSAGWSTTAWDSPPQLTASGTLQNVVNEVRGIELIATNIGVGQSYSPGDSRLRVIELSPRLEVDLSNYVYQVNCKKDLVSTQSSGLPFSYINANSGTIDFSNIPSYYSGKTTFENDSKSSVFYNLMRQGVKFTALLKPSVYEKELKEKIPLFVMYSDSWTLNDLDSVSVELLDITKLFMMGSDSLHYFAYDTDVVTVIKELLDYSGFSDYDYNGLYQLPEINSKVSGFWTDEQKTIFTNLQEFLVPQQIAASIDEYGILRFESLSQVFNKFSSNNFSADFAITDYPVSNIGSSSSRYIANIIPDTFSETIGQKIGAIIVNYKTPLTFRSNVDKKNKASSLVEPKVNTVDAPHSVWTMKESDGLSQFFLNGGLIGDSRLGVSVGKLKTVTEDGKEITKIDEEGAFVGSRRTPAKMSGDLLIGSEVVGYSGMEYTFTDMAYKANTITRTIYDYSDLASAISDFQIYNMGKSFGSTASIQFAPTGRIMNTVRGKYGTTPYDHKLYGTLAETPFRFFSASPGKTILNSANVYNATQAITNDSDGNMGVLKISSSSVNQMSIAQVKSTTASSYNFFSLNFKIDEGTGLNTTGFKNIKTKAVISIAKYNGLSDATKKGYIAQHAQRPNNSAVGMIFNTAATAGDSQPKAFCVEIQQTTGSGDTVNKITVYNLSTPDNLLVNEKIDLSKTSNIFDGDMHSFNLYFDSASIVVLLDGDSKRYDLKGAATLDPATQCYFGAYIKPLEKTSQSLFLYEFYAADYAKAELNQYNNRHYTSSQYLDNLIGRRNKSYTYFHYASPPLARGINFYDVKLESAPVFTSGDKTISIQKIAYNNAGSDWTTLQPVSKGDISYSTPIGTAFQQKFAIAHDGPINQGLIILNTGQSQSGDISTSLTLLGNNMYLSEQKTLKRIIDSNYANNTISLTMDWVRDLNQVEKAISNIIRANSGFNLDYSIRVFGNPLIQAGDFGQITYKLKKIGVDPSNSSVKPLVGLITSVRSTYRDGFDNTELTFKPMIIS
jgi:hypothetical protein